MTELSQRLQWARVEYQPALAQVAFAQLAASSPDSSSAGLKGSDSVHMATYLAGMRDVCASWDQAKGVAVTLAVYTKDGEPVCLFEGNAAYLEKKLPDLPKDAVMYGVAGDAPFRKTASSAEDWNPTTAWGKKLALAIDQCLIRMGKSEQGGEVPPEFVNVMLPVGLPVALIVIVTGAALAVIGSVAVWRYLDPDLRRDVTVIKQAADSYVGRLNVFKSTGVMPPPSPVETDALETVEKNAKARSGTDWIWGASLFGGIAIGTLVAVAITKATSGKAA